MPPLINAHCFTTEHNGIANVLKSLVNISLGFDPKATSVRPSPKEYTAIWDTGATNSVITKKVVQECGLKPISMVQVNHAGGTTVQPVYLVNIYLPNKVVFYHVRATEGDIKGSDVLVGMDIINKGDFVVTNKDGETVFSFRCPSIERIDFVKQRPSGSSSATPVPPSGKKIGRNEPCKCGSGKKYKKCCGRGG